MRLLKLLLTILVMLICKGGFSQKEAKFDAELYVSCGAAGYTSGDFKFFDSLIKSKNFKFLREKLFSQTLMDQILSVVTLEELSKNKFLVLNAYEILKITDVKKSDKSYKMCFTCVMHFNGKVSEIFIPQNQAQYEIIKRGLDLK